jgi:hypothetical protein
MVPIIRYHSLIRSRTGKYPAPIVQLTVAKQYPCQRIGQRTAAPQARVIDVRVTAADLYQRAFDNRAAANRNKGFFAAGPRGFHQCAARSGGMDESCSTPIKIYSAD